MPSLLSGSTLRSGGSNTFIQLKNAQPQLPPTPTTATGFTVVTNSILETSYASSLGFLSFTTGTISNQLDGRNIVLAATGTAIVVVSSSTQSISTTTGALVVTGGVGVGGGMTVNNDIVVNGILMGQGYSGINNIVLEGQNYTDPFNSFNNGQESISIGWNTLKGISTSYKSIVIGTNAASSGTNIRNTIAIGDSALNSIGTLPDFYIKDILNLSQDNPVVVTINNHGYTLGEEITINGVNAPYTQLNAGIFYVYPLDVNNFALYSNNILSKTVDGTSFPAYVGGGTVNKVLNHENNIAVGTNAGRSLIDGVQNFFMGDNIATGLTTGSYNFFLGHNVANNLTNGNGNISIMGDNLVDGQDNQVNIGGVFYYNGTGYLDLQTDVGIGLGTSSTGTMSGSLVVLGGVGIADNLSVFNGANIGGIVNLTAGIDTNGLNSGTLLVTGGASISRSLQLGGNLVVDGEGSSIDLSPPDGSITISPPRGNLTVYPGISGNIDNTVIGLYRPNQGYFTDLSANHVYGGRVYVQGTETSTSTNTGVLQVAGGVGVGLDVFVGGGMTVVNTITGVITTSTNIQGGATGSLPYQTTSGVTTLLPISTAGWILLSTGTAPVWTNPNTLAATTATTANNLFVNQATATNYYIGLTEHINASSPVDGTSTFYLSANGTLVTQQLSVTSTLTSTSTTTGAVTVAGGIGIQGNVYSADGNPYEGYKLYSPSVTISASAPVNPRVGDFWLDSTAGIINQFMQDGPNRIWVQFGGI